MVRIRNVPETLNRKLKVRAADAGQTLSDYLLAQLERLAARPTRGEMLTRLHSRKRVTLKTPAAMVVRDDVSQVHWLNAMRSAAHPPCVRRDSTCAQAPR